MTEEERKEEYIRLCYLMHPSSKKASWQPSPRMTAEDDWNGFKKCMAIHGDPMKQIKGEV